MTSTAAEEAAGPQGPPVLHRFTPRDILAGVSVALLLIPQALAYAELAGVPAHIGLYAAAAAPIAAAFAASSPYLQTGPGALSALLTLGALVQLAPTGTGEYVALAALLALMVGAMRLLVGVLRAGDVAYLMSRPVVMGFTSGAAVLIVASQLPGALGLAGVPGDGVMIRAWNALSSSGSWNLSAVGLAVVTIAVVRGGKRVHPLFPGVLAATALGLAFSLWSGYAGPVLGEIPRGLPAPSLALPWGSMPALVLPAVVIALIGFAEPAAIARTMAAEEREPWDPSREFISQGMANLASGLFGSFPVGGSFGRSAVNRMAGATSRWSGMVAGLCIVVFLPVAFVLAPLPVAILAGIIIAAVSRLVKIRELLSMAKESRLQAVIGVVTFSATILLSPRIDQAVVLGILFSIAVHAWREMQPHVKSWREGDELHIEPEGVLWFASTPELEQEVINLLAEHRDAERVVVHLSRLGRVDYTGALGLRELREDAERAGVAVTFTDVPTHARRIVDRVLGPPGVSPDAGSARPDRGEDSSGRG